MTYEAIIRAAEDRAAGDTRAAWSLADALLAQVPAEQGHRADLDASARLSDHLEAISVALASEGILTPGGDPYSPRTLKDLRALAMSWSEAERHDQASMTTHAEARDREGRRRQVLAALCQVAVDGDAPMPFFPNAAQLEREDWLAAVADVLQMVENQRRYPVTKNALRLAMGTKLNRQVQASTGTIPSVLKHVAMAQNALRAFGQDWGTVNLGALEMETRDAVASALTRLMTTAQLALTVVEQGAVTDQEWMDFLNEEADR